ncbi:MAG: HAD family hydrolase [Candidatus Bathyarchaeota archaeon]|nr:MAG: HAD family hydrolase [Candidatus Bathyarchaeota archaeon]
MRKEIQGILFDFGGTLYDYYPSNFVIWSRIVKRLGVDISPDDPRIWKGIQRQSIEATRRAKPFSKLSREEIHTLNLHALAVMGIDGEGTMGIIGEEFDKRGHGYRINPETKETLERIYSMDLKIGLISNCPPEFGKPRRQTMKEDGILHYFYTIILSGEVGHAKPEKEIFKIALNSLGLQEASEVINIGDSLLADVIGAQNAGLIPVLYDQFGFHSGEDILTIQKLSEIFRYLM